MNEHLFEFMCQRCPQHGHEPPANAEMRGAVCVVIRGGLGGGGGGGGGGGEGGGGGGESGQ
jgi:hypothetical protein